MRRLFATCAAVFLLLGPVRAQEPAAAAELAARLAVFEQLSGRFEQRVSGETAATPSASSGRFSLRRPDQFRWEITAPDSQLLVASDGVLWHYDRDLETVTRRSLAASGPTPLLLLAADEAELADAFAVSRGEEGSYRLVPLASGAGFREATLRFDDGLPAGMEVVDNLGQLLTIRFLDVSRRGVGDGDFTFTPPPGVDVYRDDGATP